jgi:hypothetical protein
MNNSQKFKIGDIVRYKDVYKESREYGDMEISNYNNGLYIVWTTDKGLVVALEHEIMLSRVYAKKKEFEKTLREL